MRGYKNMIKVLMDGIKDADMIMDYAAEAMEEGQDNWANWFKAHAQKRLDIIDSVYQDVSNELSLDMKARQNDPIASAFKCHIEEQINDLKSRMMGM